MVCGQVICSADKTRASNLIEREVEQRTCAIVGAIVLSYWSEITGLKLNQ